MALATAGCHNNGAAHKQSWAGVRWLWRHICTHSRSDARMCAIEGHIRGLRQRLVAADGKSFRRSDSNSSVCNSPRRSNDGLIPL